MYKSFLASSMSRPALASAIKSMRIRSTSTLILHRLLPIQTERLIGYCVLNSSFRKFPVRNNSKLWHRQLNGASFEVKESPAPGSPFHLAIPVHSMLEARKFYGEVLGLKEGRRSADKWQDYSLQGHQIVCHFVGGDYRCPDFYNPVDGDEVPVPHFGLALSELQFFALRDRLKQHKVAFIIEPHKRFVGQPGEQWTMFFKDPSGNNLEFKAMTNPQYLFAKYNVLADD